MGAIVCCTRTPLPVHMNQGDEDEGTQYIGVYVLQAAPISPDLTVTENLWTILDTELDGRVFISIKHLQAAARIAWETISVCQGCQLSRPGAHQWLRLASHRTVALAPELPKQAGSIRNGSIYT